MPTARTLHDLARLHGMAFAWRLSEETPVRVAQPGLGSPTPWFGLSGGPSVPYRKKRPPKGAEEGVARSWLTPPLDRARQHLDAAIANYRLALEAKDLADQRNVIELGLAWTLRQRGLLGRPEDTEEAVAVLRPLVERTTAAQVRSGDGGLGVPLSVEAARDLLTILASGDVDARAGEVAQIEERLKQIDALPRAMTPLALDLGGAEVAPDALVDARAAVRFDLDGSGRRLAWTWITPRAAWLVWDPRATGEIRGALQLFGNRTFNLFHSDGFAALSLLDDDGDGVLRGAELEGLAAWRDTNSDGRSTPKEVMPLAELGIVELSVEATKAEAGWLVSRGGARRADGSSFDVWDLILETARVESTVLPSDWMKVGPAESF